MRHFLSVNQASSTQMMIARLVTRLASNVHEISASLVSKGTIYPTKSVSRRVLQFSTLSQSLLPLEITHHPTLLMTQKVLKLSHFMIYVMLFSL